MRYIHIVHLDASHFDRMTTEERQDVDRRSLAANATTEVSDTDWRTKIFGQERFVELLTCISFCGFTVTG